MMAHIAIWDTSLFCVWMRVPHMERTGPDDDAWDFDRVNRRYEELHAQKYSFILPIATIIETGNHLVRTPRMAHGLAVRFGEFLKKVATGDAPWRVAGFETELWQGNELAALAEEWPRWAAVAHGPDKPGTSMGDMSLIRLCRYLRQRVPGTETILLTADVALHDLANAP